MSETEQRELDAWIAEHVMGFINGVDGHMNPAWYGIGGNSWESITKVSFRPTTDPAAAMEVLQACAERIDKETVRYHLTVMNHGGGWCVDCHPNHPKWSCNEMVDTLELATCLFAKKLFAKAEPVEVRFCAGCGVPTSLNLIMNGKYKIPVCLSCQFKD